MQSRRQRTALDVLLLLLLVGASYFARLGELPLVGEEGRRARGAINMLETGDWIVLRQQGFVFPDRPPMTNWLIALASSGRDGVDAIAIRLPSVLAILATTLLIYFYCRPRTADDRRSRWVAITAAVAFATFGQVLQLGRLGESEAVFTLFVAASLLLWHRAFAAQRPLLAWTVGYSAAALAALVKGLQAPVYFVGVSWVFVLVQRQWRELLRASHWLGAGCFLLIVGAWQIPYYRAVGLDSALDSWFGVVGPRLGWQGLIENVVRYPFETFSSLLPWSLLLLALPLAAVRRGLFKKHPQLSFIVTAIAVTYPTVWFSAGAKGRYYLPLYPCLAVLIAIVAERLSNAEPASRAGRARRLAIYTAAASTALVVVAVVLSALLDSEPAVAARQPLWRAALLLALALTTAALLRRAVTQPGARHDRHAIVATGALLALVYSTLWLDTLDARRQDLTPVVTAVRSQLAEPERLVSLGPVDSRFTYHYRHFVPELPWPASLAEVSPELDYFCFDRRPTDTTEERYAERGMKSWYTAGTLPFAWQELASVSVGRKLGDSPDVVLGRVLRTAGGELIPGIYPVAPKTETSKIEQPVTAGVAGSDRAAQDGADTTTAPVD